MTDNFLHAIEQAKKVEPLKSQYDVFKVLYRLLDCHHTTADILEIGCRKGKTTVFLAELASAFSSLITIHAADPFTEHGASKSLINETHDINAIYTNFIINIASYQNIKFYKTTSDQLLRNFTQPLQFAYIDGEHTEQAVLQDFQNVFPLIQHNGIIGIDDFNNGTWSGVSRAYKTILNVYQDKIIIQDNTTRTAFLQKVGD